VRILSCPLLPIFAALGLLGAMFAGCGDDASTNSASDDDSGNIIQVKPDGTGDYATVQGAIEAAHSADVIELTDGIFAGNGNRDIDCRGKPITVRSQSGNPKMCIIDPRPGGTNPGPGRGFYFHSGEGPNTRLEGITIRFGFSGRGGAVSCIGSSPTLTNCIIDSSWASGDGGGLHCLDSSPTVHGCVFLANMSSQGDGGAICCDSLSSPIISDCTLYGNGAPNGRGSGIACIGSTTHLRQLIIASGWAGGAVYCDTSTPSGSAVLSCCNIYGNEGGDWTEDIEDQSGQRGNISADPLFCNPEIGDLHLQPESPCSPDSSECGMIGAWPVRCE